MPNQVRLIPLSGGGGRAMWNMVAATWLKQKLNRARYKC